MESGCTPDQMNASHISNRELGAIESELQVGYKQNWLGPLNCYLLGVVLRDQGRKVEAKEAFMRALNQMPLLWSAWLELATLLKHTDRTLIEKQLPEHWMLNFYLASFYLDI